MKVTGSWAPASKFEVYKEKGSGFVEPVYQECLSIGRKREGPTIQIGTGILVELNNRDTLNTRKKKGSEKARLACILSRL
jgi:hypothetical protein